MASLATSVVDEYGTVDVSYSSQGYQSWSMNYRLWTPVYRTVSTTSARCQDRKYNADVYQLLWTCSHFAHGSGCKVLWSVRLCVCLCVFVCPQGYFRNHTRDLCQFFFARCNAYGRGSVLLPRRFDTLCTSGFVDDIMFFSIMGRIAVWISLRRTNFA